MALVCDMVLRSVQGKHYINCIVGNAKVLEGTGQVLVGYIVERFTHV